jgi:hypothetical protein
MSDIGAKPANRAMLGHDRQACGQLLAPSRFKQRCSPERATVAEVFEVLDGDLELIVPAGKIADRAASGTKEIALLIAGARQAAGVEDWTSLDVIREVCSDFKRLDSGNFAKTIKQMEDVFNVRRESERKMLVRMSRPGWEAFGTLVKRLGGES